MFGVSTQTTEYQREMAERLHLPFSHMMDMGPTYGPGNQGVNPNVGAGEVAIKTGTNVLYLPGIDHDHIVKDKKYRTSWYRLGGVSGFTAGAIRCPLQFVDAHLALLHVRIPSVIHHVLRAAIRTENDGMMARAAHVAGNSMQHTWMIPSFAVGTKRLVGYDVIDPVSRRLPIRAAVEAIIAAGVFHDARPLDGMPIEDLFINIHAPVSFVQCPVVFGAHNHVAITRESRHAQEPIHNNPSAGMNLGGGIGEVPCVEKVPLPIGIVERE